MDSLVPPDRIWRDRVGRRGVKITENPQHHGRHLGGMNRCRWAAGVGNLYVIYTVSEDPATVRLVALYNPG